jgi:acetylornithine deacetylase
MQIDDGLEARIVAYVEEHRQRLIGVIQDLVRLPSENTPPVGSELACQQYVAEFLKKIGWSVLLYNLNDVAGLREHPLFWGNRDYTNRPNVGARRKGTGGGRSLVLSGHIDTVPRGTQPWTRDPFGGEVEGNRLYGRGSNDMKGGIGTNLFVAEAIEALGIRLKGDLVVESIVDEEFGGVHGTLAGRLQGFNGDAAIISEPSFLRICAGQRGGRTVHITFKVPPSGGILTEDKLPAGVSDQVGYFLRHVPEFAAQRRRRVRVHELYADQADPVPVSITKISTGPWGMQEPVTVPDTCKIEMYWQMMPGETQAEVDKEFFDWLESLIASAPDLFITKPEVTFPIRWMPGSAISRTEPLVMELAECAAKILGSNPPVVGIEGPCDMYVFHQAFGIPAVLWGARGGNTHSADEYLEIDTALSAAKTLLLFVCRWCGVAN